MAQEKDLAKVVLSTHRVSFPHLIEPSAYKNSDKKEYSLEFIIPKDHPDIERIERAIEHVYNENRDGMFKGIKLSSSKFHYPLVDGDETLEEKPERLEVEGAMTIKGKSTRQPAVYDADGSEMYDLADVYGGCYCRGVLVFRPFSHDSGKKGISCFLNSVKFMEDGERLGGFSASHDDYEDEPAPKRGGQSSSSRPSRRGRDEEPEDDRPARRGRDEEPEARRRPSRRDDDDREDERYEARRRPSSRRRDDDDDLAN